MSNFDLNYRSENAAIVYRIVGEYEDEGMQYELPNDTTRRPLSLSETMMFIENTSQGDCAEAE